MLEEINKMSHKVRTSFGDSEITYGGSQIPEGFNNNIPGSIQGNGSAPKI